MTIHYVGMIYVQADGVLDAALQAFRSLYRGKQNTDDPSIWREDSAVLDVSPDPSTHCAFDVVDGRLSYKEDYSSYIADLSPDIVDLEERHYTTLFLKHGGLRIIAEHLREHPDSRRALLQWWHPHHLDTMQEAPCLTQLHFRRYGNTLQIHAHARACNAYNLLLLDLQACSFAQHTVSRLLGIPAGQHVQYIDSLHFYTRDKQFIQRQLAHMQKASVWQSGKK